MYKKLNNYFVACYSNNYSYNYVFVELIEGTSVLQVCLSMYLGKIWYIHFDLNVTWDFMCCLASRTISDWQRSRTDSEKWEMGVKKEKGWKQGWVTDAEIGVMGRVMEDGNRKSLPQNRPTSQKTGWRKKNAGNGKKPASDRDLETNDWKQVGAPSLPAPSLLSIHQLPSSTGNAYAIISSITRTNQ